MLLRLEENPCVILEHIETLDTLDKEKNQNSLVIGYDG